jgi:hypothetical protein
MGPPTNPVRFSGAERAFEATRSASRKGQQCVIIATVERHNRNERSVHIEPGDGVGGVTPLLPGRLSW